MGKIELSSADRIRLGASLTVLLHITLQTLETLGFIDKTLIGNNAGTSVQLFCLRTCKYNIASTLLKVDKSITALWNFFQSTRFHFLYEQGLFFPKFVMGKMMSESSAAAAVCSSILGKPAQLHYQLLKIGKVGREDIPYLDKDTNTV